tara:strand:+ start:3411 stop:3785 length:375 start_codon:yes stop_codon:yes gene_type:complete
MNWEKIKNNITHEKASSYYNITGSEYFGRWATARKWGWLNNNNISELGYEIYLTILTVMGTDSIYGSPKRTQKTTKHLDMLVAGELLVFNPKKKKYEFGDGMPGYFSVLVNGMNGKATPKLGSN